MANLIFDRSMISIEQREQDLNKRQRMVSFKVNDVSNKNSATEVTIKTGNWNNESNILTLLLQQARLERSCFLTLAILFY